jgi:hypothetical protein
MSQYNPRQNKGKHDQNDRLEPEHSHEEIKDQKQNGTQDEK